MSIRIEVDGRTLFEMNTPKDVGYLQGHYNALLTEIANVRDSRDAEITDLRTALVERNAEIVHAEYECESISKQLDALRAAAQQALEWFDWLNGGQTRAVQPSTDVQNALTAALESKP